MTDDPTGAPPRYLTTREAAELLRVKERKVYDLAAEGEIPHRRITGKLLFPRAELLDWIEGDRDAARPAILTGSHDPLLEWAVRDSDCGLAMMFNGSIAGLDVFGEAGAALTGLHLPEGDDWNVATVGARDLRCCVLISWARRARGLILSVEAAKTVRSVADLAGRRVARRQAGAGAAAVLDALLAEAALTANALAPDAVLARTEHDAAAAVATGDADAALGVEAMARQFDLPFLPLLSERFDLLIDRRAYFTPPVRTLLRFAESAAFRDKAAAFGGYDVTELGAVRWLSP